MNIKKESFWHRHQLLTNLANHNYNEVTLDELKAACRAKDASDQGDADALPKQLKEIDLEIRAKQMQGI